MEYSAPRRFMRALAAPHPLKRTSSGVPLDPAEPSPSRRPVPARPATPPNNETTLRRARVRAKPASPVPAPGPLPRTAVIRVSQRSYSVYTCNESLACRAMQAAACGPCEELQPLLALIMCIKSYWNS